MRRKRGSAALVVALAAVLGVVVATNVGAAQRPTVKVVATSGYGKLLATAGGLTLYHYTDEGRGKIDCKGACAQLWPPLLVKKGAKPVVGSGVVASKLGTLKRPDGRIQVTYNGFALYRFASDKKVGDLKGQGLEHSWYAIAPSGKLVKRMSAPATTPPASTPPPTYTAPSGGGGYDYG